jgi:hypothetical protein
MTIENAIAILARHPLQVALAGIIVTHLVRELLVRCVVPVRAGWRRAMQVSLAGSGPLPAK